MYGPLALLVVATALFAAGVVRRHARRPPGPAGGIDLEQVQGFVLVGSGALVVLGVGVLVLGLAGRAGYAEAMGVLGLLAYLVYLGIACVLIRRTTRHAARRAATWEQPPPPPEQPA